MPIRHISIRTAGCTEIRHTGSFFQKAHPLPLTPTFTFIIDINTLFPMQTSTHIHFPACPTGMGDSLQSNLSDVDLKLVTEALNEMEKMNVLNEEFANHKAEAVQSVSPRLTENPHVQPKKKRFGMLSFGQLFVRTSSIFSSKEPVRSEEGGPNGRLVVDTPPHGEGAYHNSSEQNVVETNDASETNVIPTTPRITLQSFDISHELGYGSQGAVYLGRTRYLKSEKLFAIKIIRKRERAERSVQLLLNEQHILSRLRGHPLLLEMAASFHDSKNYYIVTNYCSGGDLQSLLDGQNGKRLPIDRVQFFMAELVCGVHYLHKNGVIHRDLKPSNILLSSTGHIVIADFGLVRFSGNKPIAPHRTTSYPKDKVGSDHSDTWCGTVEYMPPEMIEAKPYGPAIDVWALGIIMFQMLEGKVSSVLIAFYALLMVHSSCRSLAMICARSRG
ncbi:kinase-like protein [Pluteus cervinus]|uniref:Kinase-like protein n=1 Tax=Pluteus cervinus TaxID=181527 RepID=A0ACD3AMB4_9AGAR|nr:kinase-like protein [Pluteus cervinus]